MTDIKVLDTVTWVDENGNIHRGVVRYISEWSCDNKAFIEEDKCVAYVDLSKLDVIDYYKEMYDWLDALQVEFDKDNNIV